MLCGLFLASCSPAILQPEQVAQPSRNPQPVISTGSLNPQIVYTPTPGPQRVGGLSTQPLASTTPYPTPNPIVTPHSYVKEHAYSDLLSDGQQALILIVGDRRPSPPATPTPVLQNQKGEYEGNFIYNLQIWNWNPTTNQYSQVTSWPNDPSKRYIDMRYHLVDLVGDGTQQILVQARLEGVPEAIDYQLLHYGNGQLTSLFSQSNLEHGQVRLIGKTIWQEQSVRAPNEDPCCPSKYHDDAFVWDGTKFVATSTFGLPDFTSATFPQPTPTPLARDATPVPLKQVSVPIPSS
jgi:hypothetical protein